MLDDHKGSTKVQTELRFTVAVFFEFFFYTKHSTAETIDKSKYFHSLSHYRIKCGHRIGKIEWDRCSRMYGGRRHSSGALV